MTPNAALYDPRPEYICELIDSTGLTQPALGSLLGVHPRTIRKWRNGEKQFSYLAQFGLETLVFSI